MHQIYTEWVVPASCQRLMCSVHIHFLPETDRRWTCPLRVALRRSWSGCHVNMAKIDWPDFCTDGLIVVWRKDEELIALPIRNGRVGFGIHELQGQGASLLQQVGETFLYLSFPLSFYCKKTGRTNFLVQITFKCCTVLPNNNWEYVDDFLTRGLGFGIWLVVRKNTYAIDDSKYFMILF